MRAKVEVRKGGFGEKDKGAEDKAQKVSEGGAGGGGELGGWGGGGAAGHQPWPGGGGVDGESSEECAREDLERRTKDQKTRHKK